MNDAAANIIWRGIGASVKGASHEQKGLENQDHIRWHDEGPGQLPLILAIADGHGGDKYFRSAAGSRLATEIAIHELRQLATQSEPRPEEADKFNLSTIKRFAEERLPQSLVQAWEKAVKEDLMNSPLCEEELAKLADKAGASQRTAVEKNNILAYGATILAVLVTRDFILYLQLGDGDILCVTEEMESIRPLPSDERLIANETTSLCAPNAWRDVRVRFSPIIDGQPPLLIIAATDGYSNSFVSEQGFRSIGEDYITMFQSLPHDTFAKKLEFILKTTTHDGSGDDITVGLIKRMEPSDAWKRDEDILKHQTMQDKRLDAQEEQAKFLESLVLDVQSFADNSHKQQQELRDNLALQLNQGFSRGNLLRILAEDLQQMESKITRAHAAEINDLRRQHRLLSLWLVFNTVVLVVIFVMMLRGSSR
jgi:serine/threonine protein phosphatase PrpC